MDKASAPVSRLGKRQLGRHAYEKRMPDRVYAVANERDNGTSLRGVIPTLGRLIEEEGKVDLAYLCHADTKHIYRTWAEGDHFCAYRNVQMLLSCPSPAPMQTYSVIELQTLIEKAWDMGFNAFGRVETGGIVNTRKHIGTSEAQALFQSLDLPCTGEAFSNDITGKAYINLLDYVEAYFASYRPSNTGTDAIVCQTDLPPLFLQRRRHSVTIVGFEEYANGSRSLLVFDPGWCAPKDMIRVLKNDVKVKHPKSILRAYRSGETFLKRYTAFEVLHLVSG